MPTFDYDTSLIVMDESSITEDTYSDSFRRPAGKTRLSMTYDSNATGNLVAALYLQCRNHPDDDFRTCNNASFPTAPDGSEGHDEYSVHDAFNAEYRIFVDFTSGDGEFFVRAIWE